MLLTFHLSYLNTFNFLLVLKYILIFFIFYIIFTSLFFILIFFNIISFNFFNIFNFIISDKSKSSELKGLVKISNIKTPISRLGKFSNNNDNKISAIIRGGSDFVFNKNINISESSLVSLSKSFNKIYNYLGHYVLISDSSINLAFFHTLRNSSELIKVYILNENNYYFIKLLCDYGVDILYVDYLFKKYNKYSEFFTSIINISSDKVKELNLVEFEYVLQLEKNLNINYQLLSGDKKKVKLLEKYYKTLKDQ